MTYRVTVSLGRSIIDTQLLDDQGRKLTAVLPESSEVSVDPVKAALQVVMTSTQPSALEAAAVSLELLYHAFNSAGVALPESIMTLEAEAVPAPVEQTMTMHVVSAGA